MALMVSDTDAPVDEEIADTATDQGDVSETETPAPEDALGDTGKKLLDKLRGEAKAETAARKAVEAKLREQAAQLKAFQDADADRNRTEDERKSEQTRRDAETAATTKANQRLLRSEVRAAAAGKLKNPADALAFLDLSALSISEDGDTDQAEIEAAVAKLLEDRPYLGAESKTVFAKGDAAATRKENAAGPRQWTKADLDGKSAVEIMAAKKAGLLDNITKSK